MTNDNKITKQVNKIKTAATDWLIMVKSMGNQNASTDRKLEELIKNVKELENLYDGNAAEYSYDIAVYPDEYVFYEDSGNILILYSTFPNLQDSYSKGDEILVKFEEEIRSFGIYIVKEFTDDGMILEFAE